MSNRDLIRRHLGVIKDQIETLEYLCDTEIVGEDARHLLTDIKGAEREHLHINADKLEELWDVKPLYDRLKSIQTSVRVLKNSVDRSEIVIEDAIDSCRIISNEVESDTAEDDQL
jgi:hypothetical protein